MPHLKFWNNDLLMSLGCRRDGSNRIWTSSTSIYFFNVSGMLSNYSGETFFYRVCKMVMYLCTELCSWRQGPHLLAPTGTNLEKDGQEGTILAGYHYDLNFLTIHGSCRFPGLSIWTKSGEKLGVEVPPGCLLLQTGKQVSFFTYIVYTYFNSILI